MTRSSGVATMPSSFLAEPEEMFARAERREQRRRDGAIGSIAQGVDRRGQRVRQVAGAAPFNGQRGCSSC